MEAKQPSNDNDRWRHLEKAREIGRAKEDPAADELKRQFLQNRRAHALRACRVDLPPVPSGEVISYFL